MGDPVIVCHVPNDVWGKAGLRPGRSSTLSDICVVRMIERIPVTLHFTPGHFLPRFNQSTALDLNMAA